METQTPPPANPGRAAERPRQATWRRKKISRQRDQWSWRERILDCWIIGVVLGAAYSFAHGYYSDPSRAESSPHLLVFMFLTAALVVMSLLAVSLKWRPPARVVETEPGWTPENLRGSPLRDTLTGILIGLIPLGLAYFVASHLHRNIESEFGRHALGVLYIFALTPHFFWEFATRPPLPEDEDCQPCQSGQRSETHG